MTEFVKNELRKNMADRKPYEAKIRPGVIVMVERAEGPWGQPMICGAVVHGRGYMARQWCRTVEELEAFLHGK